MRTLFTIINIRNYLFYYINYLLCHYYLFFISLLCLIFNKFDMMLICNSDVKPDIKCMIGLF